MSLTFRSKVSIGLVRAAVFAVVGAVLVAGTMRGGAVHAAPISSAHMHMDCANGSLACTEVQDPEEVFGENRYVGHDEPSMLFYSNQPGSGNQMTWQLTLPKDPTTLPTQGGGGTFNFQLHPAFWFGMALCDTQSYPEQVSTCTPDSDSNIVDPTVSPNHPGTAFVELQFYSPGWVAWPTWAVAAGATTCDPTKWCAAMNIFSLAEDPVNGTTLNSTCAAQVGGLEYFNFAFLTKNGHPTAPPNPVDSTTATFTPDP